ncbi:protein of unknown function [Pilibacter termitis]|uniref:DUF1827 family protein n=1 Tax=Pilibacter termitis TaxID=263852 RepID=A0A1T4QA05_9ENTE|nr:DUF1827 family protein [Pilibacter termitis]SKA00592.1 protein of unknown function [Pilibacter termitis]
MKLINVTNSHRRMVQNQLDNTDATLVEVFSAGNSTVIFEEAPFHNELLIINNTRNVRKDEIDEILNFFLRRMPKSTYDKDFIDMIHMEGLVEITIPKI